MLSKEKLCNYETILLKILSLIVSKGQNLCTLEMNQLIQKVRYIVIVCELSRTVKSKESVAFYIETCYCKITVENM